METQEIKRLIKELQDIMNVETENLKQLHSAYKNCRDKKDHESAIKLIRETSDICSQFMIIFFFFAENQVLLKTIMQLRWECVDEYFKLEESLINSHPVKRLLSE